MLWNWETNLANGPRFFPSGRRLGPYFWRRAEASDGSSPFSALVASRSTTSVRDRACQAAVSVAAFVVTGCRSPPWSTLHRSTGGVVQQGVRWCHRREGRRTLFPAVEGRPV